MVATRPPFSAEPVRWSKSDQVSRQSGRNLTTLRAQGGRQTTTFTSWLQQVVGIRPGWAQRWSEFDYLKAGRWSIFAHHNCRAAGDRQCY